MFAHPIRSTLLFVTCLHVLKNPGFQQTRGFIRLSRVMVKGLFIDGGLSEERYLINPYDIDLNDSEMVTIIKNIKSELSNAISHDVASEGKSIAEQLDATTKSTLICRMLQSYFNVISFEGNWWSCWSYNEWLCLYCHSRS